jgi:hypothetical protein
MAMCSYGGAGVKLATMESCKRTAEVNERAESSMRQTSVMMCGCLDLGNLLKLELFREGLHVDDGQCTLA